jgi:peptidoglycan/LPS O-acetylase OafA/YrhL
MYLAMNEKTQWQKRPPVKMIIAFVAFYALSWLEMITVPKLNQDWESYLILGPSVYVFYFFAVNIYLWLSYKAFRKLDLIPRTLAALGKTSFGIYLTHGLILYMILGVALIFNCNLLNESNFLLNSIAGLIGIVLCYEFSQLISKSPKLIRKIFG